MSSPTMPFIELTSQTPSSPQDKIMLGLYKGLWGKGDRGIILESRRKIPQLPGFDKQIALSTQSDEELMNVDEDVNEQSDFSFRYIQLPDGLMFPRTAGPLQPPTKLLIRSCYDRILEKIGKRPCAAVLGGPGIGKTFLLSYILVKKILAAEPVSYQSEPEAVYCFGRDGVFAHTGSKEVPAEKNWLHLLDLNDQVSKIPYPTYSGAGRLILASSPIPSRYEDAIKYRGGLKLWMGPFSWEEMYVTAHFLTAVDRIADIADLERVFLRYGPIPRVCLQLAGDHDLQIQQEIAIQKALKTLKGDANSWLSLRDPVDQIRYTLFGIQPAGDCLHTNPFPLSPYISDLIIQRARDVGIQKAKEVFDAALSLSVTDISAGYIFERLAFWRLGEGATINIRPIGGSDPAFQIPHSLTVDKMPSGTGPSSYSFSTPSEMGVLLEEREGQLILPFKSNFPSIEGLLRRGETIWMFQVTLAESHPIKVAGLNAILEGIPFQFLPTRTCKAKLVVITLDEGPSLSFKSAYLVATTKDSGGKKKDKWEEKLEKYFVSVAEDWLFERA